MKESINISEKTFYLIVGLCSIIIISYSLEAFAKAKDIGLFENWVSNSNLIIAGYQDVGQNYSVYLTMILSSFLIRVITPIALSLNTYLAFIKFKVTKLFIFIWITLIIGLFAFITIGEEYISFFIIISGICYFGILSTLMYLWNKVKSS